VHAPERPGEQRTSYLDIRKAMNFLDWKPMVSLEDGLARSFEWFAARHDESKRVVGGRA
jgi:nucleoside-diphosphate-sugar epimerase